MKYLFSILLCLTIQCFLFKSTLGSEHILGPRIINGPEAKVMQFPWQAALTVLTNFCEGTCGGSLISDQWIVTAAHCVDKAKSINISLGSNTRTGNDPNRERLMTTEYYQHEHYNFRTYGNDIAVVRLPRLVSFNEYIQPISLTTTALKVGSDVVVSGWGLTSDNNDKEPLNLNYVSLVTISDNECLGAYGKMAQGSFCASQKGSLVQGTCHGDSGGPLVFYSPDRVASLVGIVSYGLLESCETRDPSGFARIDVYRNWIKEKTGI